MKRITALGLLLALALPAPARGEPIRWGYDWAAFPGEVPAGSSKVAFADEPHRTAAGGTRLVAAGLTAFSTADAGRPDTFGPTQGHYALVLAVQDLASGQWGALSFRGRLGGWLSASGAGLTNQWLGPTTQSLELGNSRYTVTLDTFSPPGAPGSANAGAIGALVEVSAIGPAASPSAVPEPSALVLAALALAGGAAAWGRQRRAAARSGATRPASSRV
jgi:hypothetical protein